MEAPSPPIDIRGPSRNTSASPSNRSNQSNQSNLTSALHQQNTQGMDISYSNRDATRSAGLRQDSLAVPNSVNNAHPGARPIISDAARRGSNTGGSFMGGMSFGGMSMNSWMQDDIMMAGTSPLQIQSTHSPSFHSSSYLPKMEADFWRNLKCCDTDFADLHELLAHYEEVHRDGTTQPNRMANGSRSGLFRRKSSTPALSGMAEQLRAVNQQRSINNVAAHSSAIAASQQPAQDPASRGGFDMDTIGEMEMDFGDAQPYNMQTNTNYDTTRMRPGPINSHLANAQAYSTPHNTNPSTPATARITPTNNNPMVSQVNTPSFTTSTTATASKNASKVNSPLPAAAPGPNLDTGMMNTLDNEFGNLDFSQVGAFNNVANTDMFDLTINNPARALFSENGGINAAQAQLFGFVNGASTNPDNHGGAMQPPQMQMQHEGMSGPAPPIDPYGGEERPFKCLVVGCEKAYKNANGLRYHERHGHSSQQLTKNSDGTLSIVNPETGEAYVGTVGMEKEKPYRCEQCGKRYKNLNGLKYHKNHSPPCNPDLDVSKVSLPGMDNPHQDGAGEGPDNMSAWDGVSMGGGMGVGRVH